MKKAALVALAGVMMAGTASAAIQNSGVQFNAGDYAVGDTNSSAAIFENFNSYSSSTAGVAFPSPTTLPGGIKEQTSGNVVVFSGTTNANGKGFSPDGGGDNYLAVGGNGPAGAFGVTFTTAQQYFSFAFGTLDNYNSVILGFANGTYQTLTGTQIITGNGGVATTSPTIPAAPGAPMSSLVTGRVAYNAQGGSGITSVTFYSTQAAFEIDDLAAATPEPATWAMMIMGFGLAGSALRLRRRKANVAFA